MGQRSRTITNRPVSLAEKYTPSEPCSCPVCVHFCMRPGWWTVAEAEKAIDAGYSRRMMLEMAPDRSYGVLSPAFRGCEGDFARDIHAPRGCTFLRDGLCELHGTGHQPLECRVCHHARHGVGKRCHADSGATGTPGGEDACGVLEQAHGILEQDGLRMMGDIGNRGMFTAAGRVMY